MKDINKVIQDFSTWMEIHKEELIADWNLAVEGQEPFKIDPLRKVIWAL